MGFLSPKIDPPPPPPPAANPPVAANSTASAAASGARSRMAAAAGAGFENTLMTPASTGAATPNETSGAKALTGQ
jgi:hypothetical protein